MKKEFSHINEKGAPEMVDISAKEITSRTAVATGQIEVGCDIMQTLEDEDFKTKKGSILQTAIIAATMAVKKTFETIPLCHQIPVSACTVDIVPAADMFKISCTVKTNSRTGVEMEALNGVSVAALTIYDMCKAYSKSMVISDIQLEIKKGGKSDYQR